MGDRVGVRDLIAARNARDPQELNDLHIPRGGRPGPQFAHHARDLCVGTAWDEDSSGAPAREGRWPFRLLRDYVEWLQRWRLASPSSPSFSSPHPSPDVTGVVIDPMAIAPTELTENEQT
jgi:hypothetical protein